MDELDHERVKTLQEYRVLDTPAEEIFDNITQLAARVLQAPTAAILSGSSFRSQRRVSC